MFLNKNLINFSLALLFSFSLNGMEALKTQLDLIEQKQDLLLQSQTAWSWQTKLVVIGTGMAIIGSGYKIYKKRQEILKHVQNHHLSFLNLLNNFDDCSISQEELSTYETTMETTILSTKIEFSHASKSTFGLGIGYINNNKKKINEISSQLLGFIDLSADNQKFLNHLSCQYNAITNDIDLTTQEAEQTSKEMGDGIEFATSQLKESSVTIDQLSRESEQQIQDLEYFEITAQETLHLVQESNQNNNKFLEQLRALNSQSERYQSPRSTNNNLGPFGVVWTQAKNS